MAKSGGYLYNNLMVLEAINDHIAEYKYIKQIRE